MNQDKIKAALDTEFTCDDLSRDLTARDYLKELLRALVVEGEGFSGKRPFGNSGWQNDLAVPLVLSGVIEGYIDEDGCAGFEWDDYDAAVVAMVDAL